MKHLHHLQSLSFKSITSITYAPGKLAQFRVEGKVNGQGFIILLDFFGTREGTSRHLSALEVPSLNSREKNELYVRLYLKVTESPIFNICYIMNS